MLSKDEIMERYKRLRKFTATFTGEKILEVEDDIKEITKTCCRSLNILKDNNLLPD